MPEATKTEEVKPIETSEEVRSFTLDTGNLGRGAPFLRVPGLKQIISVTVGGVLLDAIENRDIPAAPNTFERDGVTYQETGKMESHEFQNYRVGVDEDETPILIRGYHSNDGHWPEKVLIEVNGEWEVTAEIAE